MNLSTVGTSTSTFIPYIAVEVFGALAVNKNEKGGSYQHLICI